MTKPTVKDIAAGIALASALGGNRRQLYSAAVAQNDLVLGECAALANAVEAAVEERLQALTRAAKVTPEDLSKVHAALDALWRFAKHAQAEQPARPILSPDAVKTIDGLLGLLSAAVKP